MQKGARTWFAPLQHHHAQPSSSYILVTHVWHVCICLQHCAYGKVEPLATFCMCACCVSSRHHHCQHAIISSSHHPGCDPISACSCHQGSAPHAVEQMAEDFIQAARASRLADRNRLMRVARTDDRTGLSHVCLHTAVCIGLLASCDMRAGVVWLESANRRGNAWREDLSSADVLLRLQFFHRGGPGVSGRVARPVEDFIERRCFCHRCACGRGVQAG